ncbi:ABC-type branched-chain amino acid transport systems, ATPase component [Thermobacillus composti KWC4]|uniref:ABC-type branched-chain amino acid transport systems, ATPase component n=1 Tax=Thermobacillus composti (strain DSM 18247 / JCM 13945 / KWC4) TaxID=717605 RepID=L0EGS6_THECK|nr:ABC transporter ATP-binding protein [Thermobacillus composti]AGA58886.1 ABC-type branched-chain amino acid transport systems, ATPase component [Thermobacillus composti KWC4]
MSLLSVRGIHKRFGGLHALKGVSFELEEGETVALIGPNGAGKTTLFNLISCEDRPDDGEIVLDGQRIDGLPAHLAAARGLARTFQNGRVFGNLAVLENVLLGAHTRLEDLTGPGSRPGEGVLTALREIAWSIIQPRRFRRMEAELTEEVRDILSFFGDRLLPRLHQPAYSLSYANRRRTELARALALRPRVLLLDEPTAGMNPTETDEMSEVILQLQRRGQSMLLIEHKLELVMAVARRVVALDAGEVIVSGTPETVRSDSRLIEAYVGKKQDGVAAASAGAVLEPSLQA